MANYKLSIEAKDDLIRIYHYGVERFGATEAEKYFNTFFQFIKKLDFVIFSTNFV